MENRRTGPLENRGAIDYNSKKRTALYFELHITEKGDWIMKKCLALSMVLMMMLSVCCTAFAVNEDVEGELVIYSSMYREVLDMMDEAIKAEFPNLTPGNEGSFFFYSGTSKLITKIYGEMGEKRDQPLQKCGHDLL